ncbi:MFS general substrate transporter [Sistotremastrum niveocremeum HHB9708]|uniref:MFS general substrate transporter n=1 Tax=Sistotremastrum niveocremeum HHB9708 TaxID=1314777 RepID=A0A164SUV5_9AGAM|nr:MFS general substrate transporter [Sistotremastrum niveocremeum HHB9708]
MEHATPVSPNFAESSKTEAKSYGNQDQSATADPSKDAKWKFMLRLALALAFPIFLEVLDYTVVATAQPHIASQFSRLDLQSWVGTIYLLTSTVFLPIFASFADIFGRHWAMQLSLILFLIGSALSTAAQNMAMVLAGRGIAGIGAAGLISVVRVLFADSRSLDANNIQATIFIILYCIAWSVGPTIGGLLTSVSFRWVFAINLPPCVLSMALVFFLLRGHVKGPQPPSRQRARRSLGLISPTDFTTPTYREKILSLDFIGAFLFVGGGLLVLLGLTWGSSTVWRSARVVTSLTVGGVLLIACVVWEWLIDHYDDPKVADRVTSHPHSYLLRLLEVEPTLPMEVLRSLDVTICQYAAFTSGMVMMVAFYFVAIFFTIVAGQSAAKAGVQLVYFAPGMGGGVFLAIPLIRHTRQPKYPIILGALVTPIALGFISRAIKIDSHGQINGFMAMAGAGVGLTFGPVGIQARFSLPPSRTASVESLTLFFRTFGGVVGLAQCAAVLNARVTSSLTKLGFDVPSGASLSSGSVASLQLINDLPLDIANDVREAFRQGTRWAFISLIPWTGLAFITAIFLKKISESDRQLLSPGGHEGLEMTQTGREESQPPDGTQFLYPPKPKYQWWSGLVGLVVYIIKKRRWEKRCQEIRASLPSSEPREQPSEMIGS